MVLLQALLTALLSGLFSGAVLFGLNEKRDRAEGRLRKIEEAIEAHNSWYMAFQEYLESYWGFGTLGNHDAAEQARKMASAKLDAAAAKAAMLRGIYLPEAIPAALKIMQSYRDFVDHGRDIRRASLKSVQFDPALFDSIGVAQLGAAQSIPLTAPMFDAATTLANRPLLLRRYKIAIFRKSTPRPAHDATVDDKGN